MPKVSVVVPTYNVDKYLSQALDSLVNQTLSDIEIICLNNSSTDNSLAILNKYANTDSRIKVITKENDGYSASCNMGIEVANGEYIAFLDPDDFIDVKMMEDLYTIAKEKNVDVVKSPFFMNIDTPEIKKIITPNWQEDFNISKSPFKLEENPIFLSLHPSIWSCLYKKEFLVKNNIKFIKLPGTNWTDNPFQVATLCLAQSIAYTDVPYYYYRITEFPESKKLKNFNIPFDRSEDIHKWLVENNITNSDIQACLYKREMGYIGLVAEILKIKDLFAAKKRVETLISLMDKKIIFENKYITDGEKKLYSQYERNFIHYYMGKKLKELKRKIINKISKGVK